MASESIPTASPVDEPSGATTREAGQRTDEGRGRIFPCSQCGADLKFHIGQQSLKCEFCGHVEQIAVAADSEVTEQDFEAMLQRIASWRSQGVEEQQPTSEVRCESCGANVVFVGTLTSSTCPYCTSPLQRENIHNSPTRVPVDAVLPFLVDHRNAADSLKRWVRTRWFAPNAFKRQGVSGNFTGVYLPYWTFDTMTSNQYTGERGDHYYVTVGTGKEQRQERRTRWSFANGAFQRFFDDVLVLAGKRIPDWIALGLEPWALSKCIPYTPEVLAGFLAQTYDVPLEKGFADARERIDAAIAADVRQRIGGDEQRVHSINSHYAAITYKHLLLPVWLMSYKFQNKVFQVAINASTGEVQGERPYSWIKITLAVLISLIAAAGIYAVIQSQQ